MKKHLCIMAVDDEQTILTLLSRTLEPEGYDVVVADNGTIALELFEEHRPDLVILDIVLPDIDGWGVLERIRQVSKVPVLVLTVKENEADIVRALDGGADDYVTKPVGMRELLARVQAIFRRAELYQSQKPAEFGDSYLKINLVEQKVFTESQEIRLTPMEFNLLHFLLTRAGHFVKPREILSQVWGQEYLDDVDLLRTCVWQLRRKIEPKPAHPKYIINRPGFGYQFNRRSSDHS